MIRSQSLLIFSQYLTIDLWYLFMKKSKWYIKQVKEDFPIFIWWVYNENWTRLIGYSIFLCCILTLVKIIILDLHQIKSGSGSKKIFVYCLNIFNYYSRLMKDVICIVVIIPMICKQKNLSWIFIIFFIYSVYFNIFYHIPLF